MDDGPLARRTGEIIGKEKMPKEHIENAFTFHPPKPEREVSPGVVKIADETAYASIRLLGKGLAYEIEAMCPESRERSLAMTKLEESVMWANASIARHG